MYKKAKKYSIFALSAFLIMSNFSFATQQMLCWMNLDEDVECECTCTHSDISAGLTISDKDTPCCTHKTIELTNTNNLQTNSIELPKDITSFPPSIVGPDSGFQNISVIENSFNSLRDHVPKSEIPILFSSLLI